MQKQLIISTCSIIALLAIGSLLKKYFKKRKLRKKVLASGTDDYRGTAIDIALSISKAQTLYKELITKSHPDRFPTDTVKQARAAEITALLTDAKRNYRKLIEIQNIINNDLN
jgi:hypothetical protein